MPNKIGDHLQAREVPPVATHLEVSFDSRGITQNATVQFQPGGVTITVENAVPVFVDRKTVDAFAARWQEVQQNSANGLL